MRVRPAESSDVDAVASLYDQLAPDGASSRRRASDSERLTWQQILSTPGLVVLVADDQGEVVGTAAFLLMPSLTDNCSPTGFVENMVVDSSTRRRGVGRAMIDEIVHRAGRARCLRLQVLSHKDHGEDAHHFYRECGFIAEAEGFRRYL